MSLEFETDPGDGELDDFEAAMSEEGLDGQAEDTLQEEAGAGPAESPDDEADPETGEPGPTGPEGEIGEGEEHAASRSAEGAVTLPEGYSSWNDYFEKSQQEQQRLQAELEQRNQALHYAAQQRAQMQGQLSQFQQYQAAQRRQAQSWADPLRASEDAIVAAQAIGTEHFKQFPEHVQVQAQQYAARRRQIQQRLYEDPLGFVGELAARTPVNQHLQQELGQLKQLVGQLQAEKIRRDHADLLGEDQGVREYLDLSTKSPKELAFMVMRLQRAQADTARSDRQYTRKQRDQEAKRAAARGSRKRSQARAGKAQRPALSKKDAADPLKVAQQVLEERRMGD